MTGPHIAWLCGLVVFALVTLLPVPACAVPDAEEAVDIRTAVQRALPQLGASCNRWQKVRASYTCNNCSGRSARSDPCRLRRRMLSGRCCPRWARASIHRSHRTPARHAAAWGERNTVYRRAWLWFWFRTRSAPLRTVLLCVMRVRIGNRSGGLWQYVCCWREHTTSANGSLRPSRCLIARMSTGTYDNEQARFAWADGEIVYTDRTNNTTVRHRCWLQ